MAIEPKTHYWIHSITLSDDDLIELELHVKDGRSEFVAGKLLGMLKQNGRLVVTKESELSHSKKEGDGE